MLLSPKQRKEQAPSLTVKIWIKLVLLRVLRYLPSIIITMLLLGSFLHFYSDGLSWFELGNLYDCQQHWWTPLLFINDLVPYYVKDLRGCMRFTAIYAIELKYFLFTPWLVNLYNQGLKFTACSICLCCIIAGYIFNVWAAIYYELTPGILNLVDYQMIDIFALKPWVYLQANFLGLLLSFFYQEIRTKDSKLYNYWKKYMMKNNNISVICFVLSFGFFGLYLRYHSMLPYQVLTENG
jgi:hypothetical protein